MRLHGVLAGLRNVVGQDLGDVGAVPSGLGDDLASGLGVNTELTVSGRGIEQLLGLLDRQLVRCHVVGDVRPLEVVTLTTLHVGPVPTDAQHDAVAERHRVDLTGIDLAHVAHQRVQPGEVAAGVTEVEALEHPLARCLTSGDEVEDLLHLRREAVVDQIGEVPLHQVDDAEREERRNQRRPTLEDVAPVDDRADGRRVGRRTPDAALLERLHQTRLGVPAGGFVECPSASSSSAVTVSPSLNAGRRRSSSSSVASASASLPSS